MHSEEYGFSVQKSHHQMFFCFLFTSWPAFEFVNLKIHVYSLTWIDELWSKPHFLWYQSISLLVSIAPSSWQLQIIMSSLFSLHTLILYWLRQNVTKVHQEDNNDVNINTYIPFSTFSSSAKSKNICAHLFSVRSSSTCAYWHTESMRTLAWSGKLANKSFP